MEGFVTTALFSAPAGRDQVCSLVGVILHAANARTACCVPQRVPMDGTHSPKHPPSADACFTGMKGGIGIGGRDSASRRSPEPNWRMKKSSESHEAVLVCRRLKLPNCSLPDKPGPTAA